MAESDFDELVRTIAVVKELQRTIDKHERLLALIVEKLALGLEPSDAERTLRKAS